MGKQNWQKKGYFVSYYSHFVTSVIGMSVSVTSFNQEKAAQEIKRN